MLIFLLTFSIPYIRHRMYELFAYSHIPGPDVELESMFWHTKDKLQSGNSFASLPLPSQLPAGYLVSDLSHAVEGLVSRLLYSLEFLLC